VGRFGLAALALALSGRFAAQGRRPRTAATLPSDSFAFGFLVLGTILVVGRCASCPPWRSVQLPRRYGTEFRLTSGERRSSRSASFQPPSVERDTGPDSLDQTEWPSTLHEAIQRPQHAGD
jgi:hypothetical protein